MLTALPGFSRTGPDLQEQHVSHVPVPSALFTVSSDAEVSRSDTPDLVVLSHLRWPWVWQRPQHLISRLADARRRDDARTWFVEEPAIGEVPVPQVRTEELGSVTRVWLELPPGATPAAHPGFDDPAAADYGNLLLEALSEAGRRDATDVWLYTPMALDLAQVLRPGRMVYDVMDDLASFLDAPDGLVLRQRRLLAEADVVFTGGPSLHRSVQRQRRKDVHLFRSGVETAHFAAGRLLRQPHGRPVAGYVGVIDERLDLAILADLAAVVPDWTIRMVGPVAKIDPDVLPQAPNLEYLGMTPYEQLPAVMADLDVALMPFALNEATRSISPTKTLEYLAAGLPVVSTRVPDIVADYSDVVHLADDGQAFAAACRAVVRDDLVARDRRVRPLRERQEWDVIAASMARLLDAHSGGRAGVAGEEPA
jgi:UDP-galactopyranose mutase